MQASAAHLPKVGRGTAGGKTSSPVTYSATVWSRSRAVAALGIPSPPPQLVPVDQRSQIDPVDVRVHGPGRDDRGWPGHHLPPFLAPIREAERASWPSTASRRRRWPECTYTRVDSIDRWP